MYFTIGKNGYAILLSVGLTILIILAVLSVIILSNIRENITDSIFNVDETQAKHQITPINWAFHVPKYYDDSELHEWSEPKQRVRGKQEPESGEDGTALAQIDPSNPLIQQILKENGYNLLATEMSSLHRTTPDFRCEACKHLIYPKKLPNVSFIVIFHNEAWSLVLRTIWSIIEHSPGELIEEIILVDDLSDLSVLKRPLEDYIEILPVSVKLLRTEKREGLIRARLIGAREAKVRNIYRILKFTQFIMRKVFTGCRILTALLLHHLLLLA